MRDEIFPECGSPNLQRYEDGAVEWKILFSPEFSGHVFTCSEIMMDTVVTNTIGLVNLLELRLGLHYDEVSAQERMALYYDAVSKYMEAHPKNVMAESFKTSGLTTAKAMLGWRDELRSADWDFDGASISSRLSVLIGVEEYFRKKDGCDMAGRLHIVTDQVAMQKLDCSRMTCLLACDKDWFKPNVRELFNALERQGAKLELIPQAPVSDSNLCRVREMIFKGRQGKITLDENDSSLLIYQFNDERQAAQYLAYEQMDDVDLWINADNKQMDNWLLLMNKAMTGSITSDCTPQLTQLFVMGLGLFATPLNVNTLIEWLNMPLHPLDSFFRSLLAGAIVKEGGYRNDVCRNLVKDYVDGKFVYLDEQQKALSQEEQQEIREKGRELRQKKVDVFLPPLQASDEIETEKVRLFVSQLASWSRQRAHLMDDGKQNLQWIEQLTSVAGMCDALHILLSTISLPVIDYQTIDSWMSGIYEKGSFTNAVAEKGCRMVVDSPSKIASVAQHAVWMGVDGDDAMAGECAFLYPSEKLQLTQQRYIRAWDESMQNRYHQFMSLTPLRMTVKQLILVVCLSRAGEATLKHPLMVRLEQQVSNLDKFIRTPKIDEEKLLDVRVVDREEAAAEIQFDHASKLQWPDHLSPTSIATPKEIAERLKEYDAVYKELVEAKGAILQLAENKLTEKLLHEQLRSCLDSLLEILKDNEQKVLHQFARYFDLREVKDFRPTSSIDYNVWQGHLKAIIGYATNYEIDDFSRSEEESLSFIRGFVRKESDFGFSYEELKAVVDEHEQFLRSKKQSKANDERIEKLVQARRGLGRITMGILKNINSTIGTPKGYGPLAADFQDRMSEIWTSRMVYEKQEAYIRLLFSLACRWKENFAQFKKEKNLLDYNDMEKYMRLLLKDESVAREISLSYRYLFVDEFQDSSPIQVKIFDALSDLMEHSFWVGDYKQAIYGFRGSDIALTKAVVDRISLKEDGCDTDTLDTSWRSLPDIVQINNAIFKKTFAHVLDEKNITLKTHRENSNGTDSLRFFHSSDDAGVAEHVLKLLSQQVNPHDIAVLARTNSTLKDVSEKLKEYGIPSSREDFPIIETKAYTLASSLLRIVESSNDALAKATVAYLTEQDYNTRKIIEEKILLSCDYIYDTISIKEIWKIIRLLNDKIVSLHLQ